MLDHITEFQPGTAQFCVPLQISYAESADLHSTPVRMTADFGELSGGQVESGWLDPHTIRVERHYADGRKEVLPVRFEEPLGKIMFNGAVFDVDEKTAVCKSVELLNFCEE